MLYNLDWLKENNYFPPLSELRRLKAYKDNANLFDDEPSLVLKPYADRFAELVNALKDDSKIHDCFFDMPNYWQLSTIKTVDLMIGEEPNIICEKAKDALEEILQKSNFHNKLNELVIDNDALGECIVRPYINSNGERDFVSQSPTMWFPICNPENIKEITADVLCWVVCTYQDANHPAKNKYELNCKIQTRGDSKIEIRRYSLPTVKNYDSFVDKNTNENFGPQVIYTVGKLIENKVEDAQFTQLIINIPGITTSRSLHGISNYDRITAIVAEIAIRRCLASFILDQNSAPRMAAPESAFARNENGVWVMKTGGRNFVVAPNEQPPIYITWDGSLQANEARIDDLKKELYSMCEVGPVINQEEMNSSQGYEALNVKLTNAKLKVRRVCKSFKQPLKQLIAFLINSSSVKDKDINIIFNDGIPVSEYQNILTAQAKKNLGVSLRSILVEYFGLTDEQAQEEVDKANEESASAFIEAFGVGKNGDFGGGKDDGKNGSKTGDDDGGGKSPKGKEETPLNGDDGAKGNKE